MTQTPLERALHEVAIEIERVNREQLMKSAPKVADAHELYRLRMIERTMTNAYAESTKRHQMFLTIAAWTFGALLGDE